MIIILTMKNKLPAKRPKYIRAKYPNRISHEGCTIPLMTVSPFWAQLQSLHWNTEYKKLENLEITLESQTDIPNRILGEFFCVNRLAGMWNGAFWRIKWKTPAEKNDKNQHPKWAHFRKRNIACFFFFFNILGWFLAQGCFIKLIVDLGVNFYDIWGF